MAINCKNFEQNNETIAFNPIEDGGEPKKPPRPHTPPPATSFSSVTSTNIVNRPENYLTFRFNPFTTLV